MRIEGVRVEAREGAVRLLADVVWEDVPRPPTRVFFEVDADDADALAVRADAFVAGLLPAAAAAGERRVLADGALCPLLASNLADHVRVLVGWGRARLEPVLDAAHPSPPPRPVTPARRALFYGGGVDALAVLRHDRLHVPRDHPDAIREAIFFYGVNPNQVPDGECDPARLASWEKARRQKEAFCASLGLPLVGVRTNLVHVYGDPAVWRDAAFGAATAAVGHALGGRLSDVVFASGGAGAFLPPHGSHPLLDDRLSSGGVRVHSGLPYRTRFERVGLLADWPEALAVMRPCLQSSHRMEGNCGVCEKCRRTMLALEAWGVLDQAPAFAGARLDAEAVRRARLVPGLETLYGDDLVAALERRGRRDLADAAREAIAYAGASRAAEWRRKLRRSVAKRLGRFAAGR